MNANSPKKTTAPKKTSRATTRRKPRQEVDSEFLELSDHRIHEPQRVAVASHGMISTAHYGATAAGVEVLSDGGNAVDAAVAAAFALGVCEPAASGLGGQTMMLIHHAATGPPSPSTARPARPTARTSRNFATFGLNADGDTAPPPSPARRPFSNTRSGPTGNSRCPAFSSRPSALRKRDTKSASFNTASHGVN